MLPRGLRMRSPGDFRETTRRGRRVTGSVCVIHLNIDAQASDLRVGVVSGRAVGNSVARHRAARRIRAALVPVLGTLPPGTRLVVRALPGAQSAADTPDQVRQAVLRALHGTSR